MCAEKHVWYEWEMLQFQYNTIWKEKTSVFYYWQDIYNSSWGFQQGTTNHMLFYAAVLRLMQQENPLNLSVLMS